MGCCYSSTATTTSKTNQKNQNPPKPHNSPLKPPILQSHKTPPPPPPPEEEETVIKEVLVLSETPTLDKKQQEKNTQTPLTIPPKTQTEDSSPIKKQQQQQQQEQETSDLSQLSEIYSITETISTTTTTATATATATKGLKEDEATSVENNEVKNKSPAKVIKKRPSNGDPGSVRARRVDPSPEKRPQGRGRVSGELRTVQRNVGSRSRSPGTGRAGGVGKGAVGKSPTTVTGKTDSKPVGAVAVEGQGKREEDGKGDVMEQQLGTESLENPLVSLECFIFL